jgi:hypothetical protein
VSQLQAFVRSRTKAKVILRTILALSQVRSVNHEHT